MRRRKIQNCYGEAQWQWRVARLRLDIIQTQYWVSLKRNPLPPKKNSDDKDRLINGLSLITFRYSSFIRSPTHPSINPSIHASIKGISGGSFTSFVTPCSGWAALMFLVCYVLKNVRWCLCKQLPLAICLLETHQLNTGTFSMLYASFLSFKLYFYIWSKWLWSGCMWNVW